MSSNGLLTLSGLRARAATVLAPAAETDPPVLVAPVDALHPPAYVLSWGDPWVEFESPCIYFAQLAVICFAGRLDPSSGIDQLELMLSDVISRFRADPYVWPQATTAAPRLMEVNGISLLAARIQYRAPVSILNGG